MKWTCLIARNREITGKVLVGQTLRQVGRNYGMSAARVQEIVLQTCRQQNPTLYDQLFHARSGRGIEGVVVLREYRRAFLYQEERPL